MFEQSVLTGSSASGLFSEPKARSICSRSKEVPLCGKLSVVWYSSGRVSGDTDKKTFDNFKKCCTDFVLEDSSVCVEPTSPRRPKMGSSAATTLTPREMF